jgi:tryptophan synthase beta subunit
MSVTSEQVIHEACVRAMQGWNNARRKEWFIWASVHRPCPECKMGKGFRCVHLGKLKKNIHEGVQWPHAKRVDWFRMKDGLVKRGYLED